MSVMRLFSLVFVLVASLVHSEEAQHLHRELKEIIIRTSAKEETNGKEVTEAVGAVSNDQAPHDLEEGGGEDGKEKSGFSGKGKSGFPNP